MKKIILFFTVCIYMIIYSCISYAETENNNYCMVVDYDTALVSLKIKDTGFVWDCGNILYSSSLTYGNTSDKNLKTVHSDEKNCNINVSDINDGIIAIYDYNKIGIKYSVRYTLEKDYLKAELKISEIEENKNNIIFRISLLEGFGSGNSYDDGYFVIPDGSGALINFNNGKNAKSYSKRIYGDDISAVSEKRIPDCEQIYLPCFGILKNNNAVLAVASKGDSNAFINADTGKDNICNFSFVLRDTDTFYMTGDSSLKFTVFENGSIKSDDIEIRYYPIESYKKDNLNYSDIARKYREYIIETYNLEPLTYKNYSPAYIDFYGGIQKEVSFLGFPVSKKISLTDYSQAKEILSVLCKSDINNIVFSYNNWTDDGICCKIDTKANPSKVLGGKDSFQSLIDYIDSSGIEFYPSSDNITFYDSFSASKSSIRISGEYSKIVKYDYAYGVIDKTEKAMSLLSPEKIESLYKELALNYNMAGFKGISLSDLPSCLYGYYGKKKMSRFDTFETIKKSCEILNKNLENKIIADTANAYIFPYLSHIKNVPLKSSGYDIFDYDIPFYQIVIHGIIPYSSEAVNSNPNTEDFILYSIASGSNLYFDMIYENTSILQNTTLDNYYYAGYDVWIDTAVSEFEFVSNILKKVSDCFIDEYSVSENIITVIYSDGTVIKTDMNNKTVEVNGKKVEKII